MAQSMQDLTREAGLAALQAAAPALGRRYANDRNTDRGPDAPATTSVLSPYLRRRLILEQEAVSAALAAHGEGATKYVQEVFWRTYFKGHLETRPWLWDDYKTLVQSGREALAASSGLRKAYDQAVEGRTGIDAFDDWAHELVAQNWLHNHTRMWFASIWIFTLRLPWALGADFFMRHLMDGDPASNTLSWRWVAGLHTRGKHYVARAENIRRYTDRRYDPHGLDETPEPLSEAEGRAAVRVPAADKAPTGEVALLLHVDDLAPETLELGGARVVSVSGFAAHYEGAAELVCRADERALADGLARAAAHFGCPVAEPAPGLPLVTPWAPVGPSAAALPPAVRVRRAWDGAVWPHSTKGFFKVKEEIPSVLETLGLA